MAMTTNNAPVYQKGSMINLNADDKDKRDIEDLLVVHSTLEFLKMTSNHYPVIASEPNKTSANNLILSLKQLLPCSDKCRGVFSDIVDVDTSEKLQELNINSKFETRYAFQMWNCFVYENALNTTQNCTTMFNSTENVSIFDKLRLDKLKRDKRDEL
tara:strand:- start:328 stop:798 length:471 start_codon:yes stop_codon:yes gene_type:complete